MVTIHRMGPFRLDTETGIVFRNAEPLALGQRAVALLRVLVERAGAPVSKAALMDAGWSGLAVEESNLTAQIAALRRVFGEEPGGERWIETLPRRGYRFVGPMIAIRNPPQEEGTEVKPALPEAPSLAVLPFVNMSGDPEQEYFSDGITEDIITDLSKVSTLNVLSRHTTFTFKGKAVEIGQLAQRLKIRYVVEGSVRKAGGRVRITAQLIDASKDSQVWGERYDRELKDIFALQDEIAQAIVAALKIRLLPAEKTAIESRSTQDPKAYQLYLLGRHYLTQQGARSLEIAVRFCRQALEIDPDYARAWAVVALCQAFLHFGGSEESGLSAAEKALALDATLAEAHAARARALAALGRNDEALAAHEESLRLEPDSFEVRVNFGLTCLYLGRYEDAIEHCERAAQLLEADHWALLIAADCYRLLGRHDELGAASRRALERAEREIALHPDNARALSLGAIALAHLGEKERAEEWAARALTIEPDDMRDYHNIACAFAQMGEPDRALDLLETCLPKAHLLAWIKREPELMPLHGHPRYQALIAREEARLAAIAIGESS
ncbi:adenylate/guanylate cyclase domain-containing protein [Mesorhizobium sp. M2E.F.Ca.ET.209.01.1.1]|uniref:TPR end-of-group domain-containing protein n=1 Tax=Mesorhizobium sp. M2E.F.Ca.ET.209.01.1.1 TaxID=2500526 RepID=UPI000FDAE964|nr:winged helix-turn-helix domain-containing protein [Mesorhizobium sp. M2E.F.Ca.ET.209.01.1.1]TGS11462.1 adenylate/guanylate cyclase domain-containing protein [Mesorhizobium sp. M2E.F.Ca.ET.209.01.1.1]